MASSPGSLTQIIAVPPAVTLHGRVVHVSTWSKWYYRSTITTHQQQTMINTLVDLKQSMLQQGPAWTTRQPGNQSTAMLFIQLFPVPMIIGFVVERNSKLQPASNPQSRTC